MRLAQDFFLEETLQNNQKILEVGTGTGIYSEILKNKYTKYTGVDVSKSDNWIEKENVAFFKDDAEIIDFSKYSFDLVLTISTVEHIMRDLVFFERLNEHSLKDKKVKSIHLFPYTFSLFIYLNHGIRQYNYKKINKIKKIFKHHNIELVYFGSLSFYLVHLVFITIPEQIFKVPIRKNNKTYTFFLNVALKYPIINLPIFCALKINNQ